MIETLNIEFIDSEVDLTNCDREPIHIPGTVQPHGLLMVLSSDFLIKQVSLNASEILDIEAKAILDKPLVDLIGMDSIAAIQACLECEFEPTNPLEIIVTITDASPRRFNGIVHLANSGEVVLELEPAGSPTSDHNFLQFYCNVKDILTKIQRTKNLTELSALVVEEVKRLTGFDRVMVYRFNENGDGWIVAEAKQPEMESFLGLQYPHTDIPKQARYLYSLHWLRFLVDVNAQPVGLVASNSQDPDQLITPLDMSHCVLRSISPIHIEYLKNMGVGASMSVSLMQQKRLWGLIACHHNSAKYIPYEIRTVCEFLGQLMSSELAAKEANENLDYKLQLKTIQSKFVESLIGAMDFLTALQAMPDELLQLTGAEGAAICDDVNITLIGKTPNESQIFDLLEWIPARIENDLFVTDGLSLEYSAAEAYKDDASGLLAMTISKIKNRHVLWFRPEILQKVTWAGDPNKPKHIEADGTVTLTPRQSFAAWEESVRFKSTPWLPCEIDGAIELRQVIVDIVLRQSDQLSVLNLELQRSNAELSSFAYVSSHDLQEPLRKIQAFGDRLKTRCGDKLDEKSLDYLRRMLDASNRAQVLIDDLLTFSRVTSKAKPLEQVNLQRVIEGVLSDLEIRIEQVEGKVELGEMPKAIDADPAQMRQLFQNLIANALKFQRKNVPPVVKVTATIEGDQVQIKVADNGIGFDPKYRDRIFQIFQRLHARSEYEGTGIGLAICRKIAERHHGTLTVDSEPNKGSTFTITLPLKEKTGETYD
jgi:two-component system, chemotaxis family, sensor kinase Cph1